MYFPIDRRLPAVQYGSIFLHVSGREPPRVFRRIYIFDGRSVHHVADKKGTYIIPRGPHRKRLGAFDTMSVVRDNRQYSSKRLFTFSRFHRKK